MTPILAIDLGASPAFAVVVGTDRGPLLVESRLFSTWHTEQIMQAIAEVMQSAAQPRGGGCRWARLSRPPPSWLIRSHARIVGGVVLR